VFITACGMVSAVGVGAQSSCAAIRAGLSHFTDLPYHDGNLEPVIGAVAAHQSPASEGDARLIELLAAAVSECLDSHDAATVEDVPLIVALSEGERPGGLSVESRRSVISDVERRLGVRFHRRLSACVDSGHTAGFRALLAARSRWHNTPVPACVVCGVDSFVDLASLTWLNQHGRLKTTNNSDGVIPGEAAAAVWVQPDVPPAGVPAAHVAGLGFAKETSAVLSEEPLLGVGLAEAGRRAICFASSVSGDRGVAVLQQHASDRAWQS
jgi:3-oxoacyl-[acyl-carrier-protein] synthase-1